MVVESLLLERLNFTKYNICQNSKMSWKTSHAANEKGKQMSEQQERIDNINKAAVAMVEDWLSRLDEGRAQTDDLLASTYALLVVAALMGYSPQALVNDATKAATKILSQISDKNLTSE